MKAIEMYNVYTEITMITKLDLQGSINNNKWNKDEITMQIIEV